MADTWRLDSLTQDYLEQNDYTFMDMQNDSFGFSSGLAVDK